MATSLRDYVDVDYTASLLLLEKDGVSPGQTLLLVEGDDDKSVFAKLVSKEHCKISVQKGNNNLIKAMEKHNEHGTEAILAIKDSDFDRIMKRSLPPNVLTTDGHDLEVMILSTDALDEFVEISCRREDESLIEEFKSLLRKRIFDLGSLIGYLRLKSCQCHWGINIDINKLLQRLNSSCELSFNDAVNALKDCHPNIDETSISSTELNALSENHQPDLCRGHDMIHILRTKYSTMTEQHFRTKIPVSLRNIDAQLYLAFNPQHFQSTELYRSIKDWEADNPPYQVLIA